MKPQYEFLGEQSSTTGRVEALRKVPLFADLSDEYLLAVGRHGQEVNAQPGDVLVREGDTGRDFGLILDGVVRVEHGGTTLTRLGAGDFFGEMALLDGQPRSANVIADSPARLVIIDSVSFGQLMDAHPDLTRKLLLTLCARLRERAEVSPLD